MAMEQGFERAGQSLFRKFLRLVADVAIASTHKNLSHIAAGVAFYMLLSIFPAIAVALSIAGLLGGVGQEATSPFLDAIRPILPEGAYEMMDAQVRTTLATGGYKLGGAAVVSFVIAFWSASAAMRALMTAMYIAFPAARGISTFSYYVLSFLFTLVVMALIAGVALLLTALPLIFEALRNIAIERGVDVNRDLSSTLQTLFMVLITCASLTMVYRLGAARGKYAWRAAFRGGALATLFWIGASWLLTFYFGTVGGLTTTYGQFAAVAGMMLWFWLSALILLIGAELASLASGANVYRRNEERHPAVDPTTSKRVKQRFNVES
ncbi:MAG: YihY/virulence factor BrkB family protein [Neomegalonema sp.]|nr:YihY/virulence factor BrkB family protein [Neomegalonema sp.]